MRITALIAMSCGITLAAAPAHAEEWSPPGPITMLIGFAAGGGADTQARLIAEELEERYGWTIIPQQVTGRGGLALAQQLKNEPADGTVIAMTASETLTYNILVSNSDLALEDFTPIATTAAFGCLAWALVLHGRTTADRDAARPVH
jgi:tripartite-type tricarboxylate transporter receptor subunit TctC